MHWSWISWLMCSLEIIFVQRLLLSLDQMGCTKRHCSWVIWSLKAPGSWPKRVCHEWEPYQAGINMASDLAWNVHTLVCVWAVPLSPPWKSSNMHQRQTQFPIIIFWLDHRPFSTYVVQLMEQVAKWLNDWS